MLNVMTIIAIIGGVLFLLGILGGGWQAHGTLIPHIPVGTRIILTMMGIVFLGGALCLSSPNECKFLSNQVNYLPIRSPVVGTTSSPTVWVTIASSSTKQKWMEQVATKFQDEHKTLRNGKQILLKVSPVTSGGSMEAILNGKLKPTVWSPGTLAWVEQLNELWQQRTSQFLIKEACQPTVYTPLGFAMWRPLAEALGWPDKSIDWKTLVTLSVSSKGWGIYGHPEWGSFRLGHSHPKYSNSGLLTMASFVYSMTGKTATLTTQDVYAPQVESAARVLAQNTSKYGTRTEHLVEAMANYGPAYLHAIVTFESEAVGLNLKREKELRFPIAFIFPSEGTFWGDQPYCVLDQAEWVTLEQKEAAHIFLSYLLTNEQQALAIDSLLRPLDSTIPLRAPLDLAHGTDPQVNPAKVPPLALPNARVSTAIIDLFMITKRKATVLVVLDISGSMGGEKIRTATQATTAFLKRLQADDVVGVLTFNHDVTMLSSPNLVSSVSEELSQRINNLFAQSSTALYEVVCQATRLIKELQAGDLKKKDNRLYGIVLLSDGADTVGHPTENQMFTNCLPTHAEADAVKIFPIAFGSEANLALLKRIAEVTGGTLFTATPDSIEKVYLDISAEQ